GILRGRRPLGSHGLRLDRFHAHGSGPLPFGWHTARRGLLAGTADEGSLPFPVHVADGVRATPLARRPSWGVADGHSATHRLHRLPLAVHARFVHLRVDYLALYWMYL